MDNCKKLLCIIQIENEQQYDTTPKCRCKECAWYNEEYRLHCAVGYAPDTCARGVDSIHRYNEKKLINEY